MTGDMLLQEVKQVARGTHARRRLRVKSLGWCIFVAAITDFQEGEEEWHRDAERFLYPKTPGRRDRFDWAVSVADGLNKVWLRTVLDRGRSQWKREHSERTQGPAQGAVEAS
jgi:hypothetical protein